MESAQRTGQTATQKGAHDCLLYRDREQKLAQFLQNAELALRREERCLLLLCREDAVAVVRGLRDAGLDTAQLAGRGTLLIRSPEEYRELSTARGLADFVVRTLSEGGEGAGGTLILVDAKLWAPGLDHEEELDAVLASQAVRIICLHQLTSRVAATRVVRLMQSHRHTFFGDRSFGELSRGGGEPGTEVKYLNEACSLLLQNDDEAVYVTNREGRVVLCNRAACALFGREADDARGHPLSELLSDAVSVQIREAERQAHSSGETITFRLDSRPGEEARSWLITTGGYRESGVDDGYRFGIIRDVTELKQTQQKLRFTAHLVNVIGQAVIATDRRGTIIFWNRAAEELYGWKAREVLGHNVVEVTTSRISREEGAEIMRKLAEGESWSGDFFVKRRDGSEFLAHVTDSPIRDDAGRLIGVIGISYDITERKQAEEALATSEERFRRYFELGIIGMAVTAPDRRIIEVNDKVCEMLGYPRDELLQMSWPQLTHPDDVTISDRDYEMMLAGEADSSTLEKRYIRKDGQVIEAVISVSCLRRKDGSVDSFLALLQDVTDRKRSEREIAAYQQQLRLMAGEMYRMEEQERKHLATVLHDQVGQNLALSKIKLESLESFEKREVIRQEIVQIAALLDDVIKKTRSLTTELRPPILHELGLEVAVESLCEEFQEQTGLPIDFHKSGSSPPLPDPLRSLLFHGVRELLLNVIKHAKASSAEVAIRRGEGQVKVTVTDNGIGFDMGKRRQKESFGLFSLRERLHHLGGRVEVLSAPGAGTRVELVAPQELPGSGRVPEAPSPATTPQKSPPTSPPQKGSPRKPRSGS